MISELTTIADDLKLNRPVNMVSTRTFLEWFGVQRRGAYIVQNIREQLLAAELRTVPDFEAAWLDGMMNFELLTQMEPEISQPDGGVSLDAGEGEVSASAQPSSWISRDATYRVSKLQAANTSIVSIKPEGTLAQAVTLLLSGDFSQLPVMTSPREVKGVITWKSIGSRLGFGKSITCARDAMESHHEVRSDSSIFDAIPLIVNKDYVLVRAEQNEISGIITASDLSLQFRSLTEPFLLLSEIENLVRNMIGLHFSRAEMNAARDPDSGAGEIATVSNMTFGEYIRLLQNPERWSRLGLSIDRAIFCASLDRIRKIRNDVMHFDPDGITSDDLSRLRGFAHFLKQIESVNR